MKALLVIDMLKDFIYEGGVLETGDVGREIVPFIKEKIAEYRKEGYPIIYICDNHEVDDKEFLMFPKHSLAGTEGSEIIDELEPEKEDKIIKKRRYSGFFGTDLDLYLREKGINQLSLVGVNTNICVLYTAADARNINYQVQVYKDGVASFNPNAHKFALEEIESTLGCKVL